MNRRVIARFHAELLLGFSLLFFVSCAGKSYEYWSELQRQHPQPQIDQTVERRNMEHLVWDERIVNHYKGDPPELWFDTDKRKWRRTGEWTWVRWQ